jgi:hypothetical protein
MAKGVKKAISQKTLPVNSRKVKELQHLLNAATEEEAVRIAIEDTITNHRLTRSLNRFLDTLAKEQSSPPA